MKAIQRLMRLPERWEYAPAREKFWQDLRYAKRWLLLLDYDGTLAPFHVDRMKALPYEGVVDRLEPILALPHGRVVVISGRQIEDLKHLLRLRHPVEIWGSHGREHLLHDGQYRLLDLTADERRVVDALTAGMRELGFEGQLELKPAAVAVHWRGLPEEEQKRLNESAEKLFAESKPPETLEMMPFESGVELRSRSRTKGQVVAEILAEETGEIPAAFLGDDWTDEDGFAEIRGRGLGVLVRPEVRDSCADYFLTPPEELLRFLEEWLENAKVSLQ
jgi:trehalose-phosphatase